MHLAHEEHPDADEQNHREPGNEDIHEEGLFLLRLGGSNLHSVAHEITDHPDILNTRSVDGDLPAVLRGCPHSASIDDSLSDLSLLRVLHELGVLDRILSRLTVVELVENGHEYNADHEPDR